MADRGSYGLVPRLDTQQLFSEAQHRWLRPAEICEILCNYQKFHIASEPPNRPPSGSLFLFDRKVLRYFRKDGHNWRKKKDGKTVKEAHEKLKVGSVDVLHCYYAHGEDNENFQRRSYWMLEQELMHIVFVHYLEVKGSRMNNSPSNSFTANTNKEPSGNTDSASPTSTLSSLCEDADSADCHQASLRYHTSLELPQMQSAPLVEKVNYNLLRTHFLQPCAALADNHGQSSIAGVGPDVHGDIPGSNNSSINISEQQSLASWEEVFQQYTAGYDIAPSLVPTNAAHPGDIDITGNMTFSEILAGGGAFKEEFDNSLLSQPNWQVPFDLSYDLDTRLLDQRAQDMNMITQNTMGASFAFPVMQNDQHVRNNLQMQCTNGDLQHVMRSTSVNDISAEASSKSSLIMRPLLLNGEESLKKVDSFSRWVTKELGDVDDLHMRSTSGLSWSNVECRNVVDDSSLSPSLSHEQLFSIIDFSPKWAYGDSEIEVHISGTFLKSQVDVAKCNWSCMFGEVEVPAEVLADGILCCYAPPHAVATVPFYVTCSNRLACSEVREFDYRAGSTENVDVFDVYGHDSNEMHLHLRLERLLSFRPSSPPEEVSAGAGEKHEIINKVISLKEEDENHQMADPNAETGLSGNEIKKHQLQKLMKEKLYSWLLHVVSGSGKGLSVLDDDGEGVLHLVAALGCDWAVKPIVTAGISINFRDKNGWTALHWAAFYGREQTVAVLVFLGAAPGALTDPSPDCPLSRTPADLASGNGHKGISGFLAESSLTTYLSSLTVSGQNEHGTADSGTKVVQTISERTATPLSYGDAPDAVSMKDSLTAVCNATQAASRIYQVFRMQSFQRKRLNDSGDDSFGVSDEHALSIVAAKPWKSAGIANAAATQIQKKFRGWKKRKEFLIIRQRIVKIQAHVRGHQVRKQYRTITWSVGILEKIILRWRRKRSGLRGFRRDTITMDSSLQCLPPKEDDYDFLKEGRKQNEVRTQIALSRVKSMYHHPEGRAQYRRLLTVCEGFRETKGSDMVMSSPEETSYDEQELVDMDSLLDDETFMSIAFQSSYL